MKFTPDDLTRWTIAICLCVLFGTCTYREAMEDINDVRQEQKP